MKKDVTNPRTLPSGTLLVHNHGASGPEPEISSTVLDELDLIFRNCAKPSVSRTGDEITLTWNYSPRYRKSTRLTAVCGYPEVAQDLFGNEAKVTVRRKGEDVELGMMTMRQLCGQVRQFTGGYNPEGWRAQSFRKQIGDWSADVDSQGDRALLVIRHEEREVERHTLVTPTWDGMLSSAEQYLIRAMRQSKADFRLMQSAKDKRRIQAQKLFNLRKEVDKADGPEAVTMLYKDLADENPKVRKEFLKMISRKGYRINRETGTVTKS